MPFYLKKTDQGPHWFGQVYLTGPFNTPQEVQQLFALHLIWDKEEEQYYLYEMVEE